MDEKQKKEDEEVRKIATVVVKTLSKLEEKKKEEKRRREAEDKLKDLLLIRDDVDLSDFSRSELEKTIEILNALQYRPAKLQFEFLERFREYGLTIVLTLSLVVTIVLLLLRW